MKIVVASLTGLLALTAVSAASADMIPGPPKCPPGQVPVMSHDHIGCELAAPKNCPPGWTGIVGGHCILHTCETSCYVQEGPPLECRPFQACAELRTVRGHNNRAGRDFRVQVVGHIGRRPARTQVRIPADVDLLASGEHG